MFSRTISVLKLHRLTPTALESPEKCVYLQLVRWRKRKGTPRAPSKMYNVREPTPRDPEEMEEITRRTRYYNTQMKSLRSYLVKDLQQQNVKEKATEKREKEAEEFARLLELNSKWNNEVGVEREKFFADMMERSRDEQLKEIMQIQELQEKEQLEREEKLRLEEANSRFFITEENLDEEIEKALNCVKDYDFAVDIDGNKFTKSTLSDASSALHLETTSDETIRSPSQTS